ncbi:hypothetical protein TNCV_1814231 [Trichonephila clavipes]|nr:hypothetical protein TNCV_1814231 [Trichonephila clavipes]
MVSPLLVKERPDSGFNASRTVILTSKISIAFGGTSSGLHAEIVEIEVVSPSIVPSGSFAELKNRTVTCMVLKANDRHTSCPCHDEFRGPRSDYVRQSTCRNCGGGDRGRVAIYRPFGEFRRAKIVLSPVWCSRPTTSVTLAHTMMNFVGLDLTTSDRWH